MEGTSLTSSIVDPERRLATAYAPREAREDVALLFALDERLASIVRATREPMLGRIRLTWWREALEAITSDPRGGEPLIAALADLAQRHRLDVTLLAGLADGWMALLDPLPLDEQALIGHAEARGAALFALAARVSGEDGPDVAAAGAGWALADMAMRIGDAATAERARALATQRLGMVKARWPSRLRMLAVLTALARHDATAGGRPDRRKGSPARVGRAVWAGLTGR